MSTGMRTDLVGGPRVAGEVIPFWRAVYEVARKEMLVFVRSKRLYVIGGLFAVAYIGICCLFAYVFSSIFGDTGGFLPETSGYSISRANVVMALAIGFPVVGAYTFFLLLAIIFAFDAVVREYEDKTLFLVLSKPVTRHAFVLGKFVGAIVAIGTLFFGASTMAYFLSQMIVGQFATPGDFGRFYVGLGMMFMGIVALLALTLFGSAFSRTTVGSLLFSLPMWLVVLNLLSFSGVGYAAVNPEITQDHWVADATQYLNPWTGLGPAVGVMINLGALEALGVDADMVSFGVFGFGLDPTLSQLSLLMFSTVFLVAALLVTSRRNFD